jgi:multiple sugar transport system permease protein
VTGTSARPFRTPCGGPFGSLLLQFLLGFLLAILLNRAFPGKRIAQALVFLPWAVPTFLTGLDWAWLFNPVVGPLPHWLFALGLMEEPEQHPADPARHVGPIAANVWYGIPFLRHHAARRTAVDPDELYEAASIDGASERQQFRSSPCRSSRRRSPSR